MEWHLLRLWFLIFVLAFFAFLASTANNFYPNNTYPVIASYLARIFGLPFNGKSAHERPDSLSLLWGAYVAIAQVGLIGSCFLAPYWSDNLGRRKTIILSILGTTPGILLEAVSYYGDTWYLLYTGRLISQLFAYTLQQVLPIFLCEVASPSVRGRCAAAISVGYGIGVLMASILGLGDVLGTETQWNIPYFGFAVCVFITLPAAIWMKETPVYLAKHKESESRVAESLDFYRGQNSHIDSVMADSQNGKIFSDQQSLTIMSLFRNKAFHKQIVLTILISITYNVGNAMNSYSTMLLLNAGFSRDIAGYCTVAVLASAIVVGIVCWFVADHISRRNHFIGSTWGCGVGLLLLAIAESLYHSSGYQIFSSMVVASLFVVQLSFAFGIRPLFWILIAEIFPYHFRSTAKSLSYFIYSLSSIGINLLIPLLIDKINGWTLVILSVPLWVALPFSYKFLPETSAQDSDEIYKSLVGETEENLSSSYGTTTLSPNDISLIGNHTAERRLLSAS